MNSPLDSRLHQVKQAPTPEVGRDFNSSVWRMIEQQRKLAPSPWWMFWPEARVVFASALAAVVLSVGAGVVSSLQAAPARQSYGMEVFSPAAPHRPASILTALR